MGQEKGSQWGSRVGFILASLGMAFGAGNIWRFPRVVAANGGGAFLIAFIIANLVWAVPLLMIEMYMGKTTRLGTNGAFRNLAGKKSTWMGVWTGLCAVFIMFYYSVVTGWAIRYLVYGMSGVVKRGVDSDALWKGFISSHFQTVFFHFIAIAVAVVIIYFGVHKGLELANKIIVPSIVVILLIVMVWALTKPGAIQGLEYLFNPNLKALLKAKVWLNAFTQAAWAVGAGWGLMLTYSVYMSKKEDIATNAFIIAFADSGSSLLAGMAVLPLVFAVSPSVQAATDALAAGNTGLTFIYLTKFFPTLPAGTLVAGLFFLALAISALASLLSMVELAVRNLGDAGINRKKAAILTGVISFIFGIPSAYFASFLDNQDMVWGVGLLISGVLFAIVVYKNGIEKTRAIINKESWTHVGAWFNWCVIAIPFLFVIIFGWWIWQAVTWYPGTWWNPLKTMSPATMVVQWLIVGGLILLANNWFAKVIKEPVSPGGENTPETKEVQS